MGVAVRMAVMEALLDPRRNLSGDGAMTVTRLPERQDRRPFSRHRRDRHASSSTARRSPPRGASARNQGTPGRRNRHRLHGQGPSCPAWSIPASSSASLARSTARPSPPRSQAAAAGGVTSIVMMPGHRSDHRRHRAGRACAARRPRYRVGPRLSCRRDQQETPGTRDDRVRPAARGGRGRLHRWQAHLSPARR